jgi:hypothetical protein
VCLNGWGLDDAKVACQQLDFCGMDKGKGKRESMAELDRFSHMGGVRVAYAANASSFTIVVPKVRITGSSSAYTICELSLFDVLFSSMLQGLSPRSPVSSLRKKSTYEMSVVVLLCEL